MHCQEYVIFPVIQLLLQNCYGDIHKLDALKNKEEARG